MNVPAHDMKQGSPLIGVGAPFLDTITALRTDPLEHEGPSIQRRVFWFAFFLLALFAVIGTYPPSAQAQGGSRAPVIDQFDVESEDRLVAGSQLRFTVEGSPRSSASVRISGLIQRIPLKEVEEGVYEGIYTIKANDRITTNTTARATLKQRNRSSSAMLQGSLGVTDNLIAAVPVISPNVLAIESFTATPIEKIEPGADLDFTMIGTPGGQASVSIEGLANSVALREVKSGRYQGSYTIRRADNISANTRVSGALVVGGKTLSTNLNQTLTAVTNKISGQAEATTALPLEILSHRNNAEIGTGLTEIRGRTAPDAVVDIQVVGASTVFGGFGFSQKLLSQSTRADANGNFAFSFQPQTMGKEARYDITLTASKNGLSQVANLKLVQQQ